MSNDLTLSQSQLPAHLQGLDNTVFDELSGGVTSGFPVVSYRGKVWRIKKGGEEQPYLDSDGDPVPALELVLLRSLERPSKTFYRESFSEGSNAKPDCWSSNGLVPDSNVPTPVSKQCVNCPNNAWGSKFTPDGKQTRACSDVRRVAAAFDYQIKEVADGKRGIQDVDVLLLRVPAASLNNLKDYAERVLKPKGLPYYVLTTKVGFDADVAYPKLTFKGLRFLSEDEFKVSSELRESDEAKRVLNESAEFGEAGTTGEGSDAGAAVAPAAPEAPSPAPAKPQPVPETAVAAEQAAAAAEVIEDIAPAPQPVPPPAPAPAPPSAEAVTEPEPESSPKPVADDDFDAMLNSILD